MSGIQQYISLIKKQEWYGDGSDGDVVVNGNVTLTRNMYYNNLTVENGGNINTAGYIIYVRELYTVESGGIVGNIGATGGNGANGTALAGGAAGVAGTGTNTNIYLQRSPGGAGGAGGNITPGSGGAGVTSANGNNLVNAVPGNGSSGGAGTGAGGGTGAAGAAVAYRPVRTPTLLGWDDAGSFTHVCSRGGNGGGGGGGSLLGGGGGGGGGGGSAYPVKIHARTIDIQLGGIVRSIGGNGGNGGNGFGNAGGGGGGGGASGGFVMLIGEYITVNGTINVSGGLEGTPGLGAGTGSNGNTNGTNGEDGDYMIVNLRTGVITTVAA